MKKILPSFILLIFAFGLLPLALGAQTTDIQSQIDAITKQRDALLAQQKNLEAQLDLLNGQSQTLQGNIKTLNAAKAKLANDLKVTQANISAATLTIQQLDQNISDDQTAINDHQKAIASEIAQLNAYDDHTLLYDLLTYNNVTDVWNDQSSLSSLGSQLRENIEMLKDEQTSLAQNKASKESQKSNLVSYQSQLSGQKQVVESTQAAKAALLAQTKNQESAYQKLLADNRAREAAFEAQLFQFESQLKAAAAGTAPAPEHGLLSWPLSKIVVTQQFGKTAFSGRLYASGTHSGTDFGTPVGTPVMSAGNGVVAGLGNTDDEKGCYSYGRWLFIKYDNGLSSIYGHLSSIIVPMGASVTAGQVVGYSGGQPGAYGSGYSTGPHLHMGLFNSAGVSVQQYTASIGCKHVSIPLANPSDYLDPMAYLPRL